MDLRQPSRNFKEYARAGYYKHLEHPSRWRLRKAIEQALGSAIRLRSDKLEDFGRCVVLRTAQWALDGRRSLPSIAEFREKLAQNAFDMIVGARDLRAAINSYASPTEVHIVNRSAAGLESDQLFSKLKAPKLVLTSPPYPGVHVLYHRWQVDGRKETPAPFWIAKKLDGAGLSYYTMGDRKHPKLTNYFSSILASMSSISALGDESTIIVQMVAFSDPAWQLQRYLETMTDAGLSEMFLPLLKRERDGRLWRTVPNRRWYADQRGDTNGSQEVVLFHRLQVSKRGDRTRTVSEKSPSI